MYNRVLLLTFPYPTAFSLHLSLTVPLCLLLSVCVA